MTQKQRKWITINEAMEITGVCRRTIYNWMINYKIEVRRTPSGQPRLNREQLLTNNSNTKNWINRENLGHE